MHYLFGFSGRINRAKQWRFFLITFAFELVIALIAIFGLSWTNYMRDLMAFTRSHPLFAPAPTPWPDPIGGTEWVAVGMIALLLLLYVVTFLAVYTKRLHDRNKSVWWFVPYMGVPWALSIFVWTTGPMRQGLPMDLWLGPLGIARGVAYVIASLIGLWVFIELYFFRGTAGANRFGPDTLA